MPVAIESDRLRYPGKRAVHPPDPIYDLRRGQASSDSYYADLAAFSAEILAEINRRAADFLRGYSRYVAFCRGESPRSMGEYGVEFLTLGLALEHYAGAAETTPAWAISLAQKLCSLRRRAPWSKPAVDWLRAALTSLYFAPPIGSVPQSAQPALDRLPRLIAWLAATGEFEQEALRLRNWQGYLATLPRVAAIEITDVAVSLFAWFRREADAALGIYTRGVAPFLADQRRSPQCREDRILRDKEPAEYHLGMVAACLMNRGLRTRFDRTPRRVVLLPTCMRGASASRCRARTSGLDIECTACDPACTVNRITRRMRAEGARVCLIPHATGLSRWLQRWQGDPDCGVTAVACLLNILPGGYEMRTRGIAAQCVPLDYPGCGKHWRTPGIPTSLNLEQLVQIVAAPPN
ncbi:MAG: DUF116 domain-containing protein [Acidobacteriaceae bacterium]